MKKYNEKIKWVEQKADNLEVEVKEQNKKLQDQLILIEYKILENYIRFRGGLSLKKILGKKWLKLFQNLWRSPWMKLKRKWIMFIE